MIHTLDEPYFMFLDLNFFVKKVTGGMVTIIFTISVNLVEYCTLHGSCIPIHGVVPSGWRPMQGKEVDVQT